MESIRLDIQLVDINYMMDIHTALTDIGYFARGNRQKDEIRNKQHFPIRLDITIIPSKFTRYLWAKRNPAKIS